VRVAPCSLRTLQDVGSQMLLTSAGRERPSTNRDMRNDNVVRGQRSTYAVFLLWRPLQSFCPSLLLWASELPLMLLRHNVLSNSLASRHRPLRQCNNEDLPRLCRRTFQIDSLTLPFSHELVSSYVNAGCQWNHKKRTQVG
jgi:hypothetical protein